MYYLLDERQSQRKTFIDFMIGITRKYHLIGRGRMIKSTKGRFAVEIANGKSPKKIPPDLGRRAQLKLAAIHAATDLMDLKSPPGNRLETLSGNRKGQHSIRINDQWSHLLSLG